VAELNPEYIEKMEDVLATYEKPYRPAEPVVCLDEKPVSLHADLRPPTPAAPGRVAKRDHEYKRCGTANVFCAVEPKAGRHFTLPTPDRSAPEFAQAVQTILSRYSLAQRRCLIRR
jgi:DDE superfamily endonuclease